MNYQLHESTPDTFTADATALLKEKIVAAIDDKDECSLGLSGGSTPRPVYEALGKDSDIDWNKVLLFLVDERYIEPDSNDSNQKLIRESLMQFADVPEDNLVFPDTTQSLESCLATYSRALTDLFSQRPPDLLVLGMGNDGHIASLFPPVPESAFQEQLVLHTTTDAFAVHDRISVSPLVIMASQANVLLLKGDEKREVFEECVASEQMAPGRWPLHVALATERLEVVVDS